ncbi:MAG: DNA cytosine methyltransferase, partial [Planctomycetota bacterium]|nr:DNA cytosine methyltransferase [Planctomycetota bacterium]
KYPTLSNNSLRYIDLFCGIGGFRIAMEKARLSLGIEAECLFSSDIDAECRKAYAAIVSWVERNPTIEWGKETMQYRRSQEKGATFFFTVVTYKRRAGTGTNRDSVFMLTNFPRDSRVGWVKRSEPIGTMVLLGALHSTQPTNFLLFRKVIKNVYAAFDSFFTCGIRNSKVGMTLGKNTAGNN